MESRHGGAEVPESLTKRIQEVLREFGGKTAFDEPLAKYTSLKVGGKADALVFPSSLQELIHLIRETRERRIPWFVLGAGSNLVVREGGIRGIVIKLSHFNKIESVDGERIYAESGVLLPRLLKYAMEQSLAGLEFLCSIPGSVGGALRMNAGIPGHEISDVVESVRVLTSRGEVINVGRKEASFGYRRSRFPNGILLGARMKLKSSSRHEIQEKVSGLLKRRRETQPLSYPNVGSIFKNPPGQHAGKLIEEAGLKGLQIGGAQISEKHANFIINRGSATSDDILALIRKAGKEVEGGKGIVLELEVKIVGEYADYR